MSYLDRLRPNIELTSPEGDVFTALWRKGTQDREKKLGIFEYPNFDGTRVDDLGIKGSRYTFSIFFTGPDYDLEGVRFVNATSQRGNWTIQHPTKGELTLQLVNFSENDDPTEDGGRIRYDLNWIEGISEDTPQSAVQLGDDITNQVNTVNELSTDQFDEGVALDTAGQEIAMSQEVSGAVLSTQDNLRQIAQDDQDLLSQFDSTVRGIADTLASGDITLSSLAGQIQQLVQLPSLIVSNAQNKIEAYNNFIQSFISDPLGLNADSENKNRVVVRELFITSALAASSQSIVSGEITTRREALEIAEMLLQMFRSAIDSLELTQEAFQDSPIDQQYFTASNSYSQLVNIISSATDYLLGSSLNLLIERRITLTRNRAPIEIAATEYGDPEQIDFLIATNELKGKDILLLPSGREVLIYA